MTLAQSPAEGRVVMEDVTWDFYQRMLEEIGDGHTRLTFDNGRLEITSSSFARERIKKVLSRMIYIFADVRDVAVEGAGSTTLKREDLQKGLEPHDSYYISHAEDITGKMELDLTIDPPPDLVIEVDISRPDVARQSIYAAMGVPEIWKYDGARVTLLHLVHGHYVAASNSLALPDLPMEKVNEVIQLAQIRGQTSAMKSFREWLKT